VIGPPARIEVEIDELTLGGFGPVDRRGIAEAVSAQLAASLADWSPGASAEIERLDAGSFAIPAAARPAAVGRAVALQVRRALDADARPTAPRKRVG
jgi:hypothetical protein